VRTASLAISGCASAHNTKPDAAESNATIRPPNKAISTPAARIPRKRKRLTVLTAKSPNGMAEPN